MSRNRDALAVWVGLGSELDKSLLEAYTTVGGDICGKSSMTFRRSRTVVSFDGTGTGFWGWQGCSSRGNKD